SNTRANTNDTHNTYTCDIANPCTTQSRTSQTCSRTTYTSSTTESSQATHPARGPHSSSEATIIRCCSGKPTMPQRWTIPRIQGPQPRAINSGGLGGCIHQRCHAAIYEVLELPSSIKRLIAFTDCVTNLFHQALVDVF